MSFIYAKPYKVPMWVVIDTDRAAGEQISQELKDDGGLMIAWPAITFAATVKSLSLQGWAHETDRTMPFAIAKDFLVFAASKHLGTTKRLSGSPTRPYHTLNRTVSSEADYERLFNDLLDIEPDISLSNLFGIGENCHSDGKRYYVYVTLGNVPTNILHRLADRVITVGGAGSSVVVAGRDPAEVAEEVATKAEEALGIK